MNARRKFLVGSAIIVLTLMALAYVGFTQSKTYYHTITELSTLQGSALHQRMRVSGNVQAGTIEHLGDRVNFVLTEQGKNLPVSYVGRDPLPDTFKDGAQASGGRQTDAGQSLSSRASASQVRFEIRGFTGCAESDISRNRDNPRMAPTRSLREASASHD